ncbi:ABC transporter permease subunit [Vallitaleaceae bacterium 9-2]
MSSKVEASKIDEAKIGKKPLSKRIYEHRWYYLLFSPVLLFALTFYYAPIYGLRYAFYDYKGIKEPVFVGLANFEKMFSMQGFWNAFTNTLEISIFKLFLTTFMSIIMSLLLNEIINLKYKKLSQTIVYLPHFMSWVVTASVFALIMSPSQQGLVNALLTNLGIIEQGQEIYFLGSSKWWRPVYYFINIWKETGWGTIIFMATLAGISPDLYEAASIDGATRLQKIMYITVPALMNTIVIVLILNLAKIMNLFESVFVMQNDAVMKQADVLQTYIYTQTFNSGALPNYGYTTAVGMVKSIVGGLLVIVCNYASKKIRGRGIV